MANLRESLTFTGSAEPRPGAMQEPHPESELTHVGEEMLVRLRGSGPGLATRMAVLLMAFVVGTSAVVCVVIFSRFHLSLTELDYLELEHSAQLQAKLLDGRVEEMRRDVALTARLPDMVRLQRVMSSVGPLDVSDDLVEAREDLQNHFLSLLEHKPQYSRVRLIGFADGGREIVRVERGADGPRSVPSAALQQKGERSYMQEVQEVRPGEVVLSPLELNIEQGVVVQPPEPVLRASTLVVDAAGKPFGAVIMNVDAAAVIDELASLGAANQGFELVTEEGLVFHAGASGAPSDPHRAAILEDVANLMASADRGRLRLRDQGADEVVHLYRYGTPPYARSLAIVLVQDDPLADDVFWRVLKEVGFAVLLAVGIAALAGLLAARRVTRPIREVAQAVARARYEDDELSFPSGLMGEAAMVAAAFESFHATISRQRRDLLASNQELAQFAYVASHDLQEPLRTIHSFITLFEQEKVDQVDEEGREFLAFVRTAAERMRDLVHGLLEYSRVGSEGDLDVVDLAAVAVDVAADLTLRIEESGARLEIEELPTVRGQSTSLRILLQNLVANGLKFVAEGQVPHVRVSSRRREDGRWEIRVDDNGIGIAPEDRERIFRIFQRLHPRREYAGSGIGLAHCRKIVRQHGGSFTVTESDLGGASFRFDLESTT